MCFLSGPCCDKRFADGGKECIKGRDCLSGICVIVGEVPLIAQDNYVGKCPPYRVGNPFEFSEPYCSEAQIENGRIVKDLRKEFCPIY